MSQILNLKQRREQIAEANVTALWVPRWDKPKVGVIFKPIPNDVVTEIGQRVDAAKGKQVSIATMNANMDALINACTAVFGTNDDGATKFSLHKDGPDQPLTAIDRDLGYALGCDGPDPEDPLNFTMRDVCRALFFTDGDILAMAGAVAKWSGYVEEKTDADFVGESEAALP